MTSTNGIATERHRHRQSNTKNREESVMCVCVFLATSSLKNATHSPAPFQALRSPYSSISPFLRLLSISFFSFTFVVLWSWSTMAPQSAFNLVFLPFISITVFPVFTPPPLFFIQCIYLLTAFAYFNLLSTTPFPWISHLHVSPFWTLSIFLAHQAVMNSPSTFWFLALCCSISKPRVKTPFCAWLQQVLQND